MAPPPRLALDRVARIFDGRRVVDGVSIEVAAGEVLCLLGPSGCGKTTTLRIAAGVERQDEGTVSIDGREVSGPARHEPPECRSVGLMFQDFALFPHLDAADNVAFGLHGARADKRLKAEALLERVGLSGFGPKFPHMLSGGEQQRVALARALAPKPRAILMDEPFSGLDNRLRDKVREEALSLLRAEGAAVLLVTHDPEEAMRCADRIALMRAGRIVQEGAPYNVYNRPADREAAAFLSDVNVIHGVVDARQMDTPFGRFLTPNFVDGADIEVVIRPEHLKIDLAENGRPEATARTGVPAAGAVERARFVGSLSLVDVRMEHDGALLSATAPGAFLPAPGARVWLSLRRDHCHLFPCSEQRRVADPWVSAAQEAAE
mgnify:CR=1 FL=1